MQVWGDNEAEPRHRPSKMGSSVMAAVVLGALVTLACSSSGTDGASPPPDTTGPSGCKSDAECASGGAMLKCNVSTGQCVPSRPPEPEVTVGAACARDGELACGIDPNTKERDGTVLHCEGSKYTKVYTCPGLQECTPISTSDQVKCGKGDQVPSFAKEGAPCATEGNAACSFDRQVMHECVNGTWVAARHCPPSECTLQTFDGVLGYSCANGGYTVGDRCKSESGAVVCSTDLTKILSCADGRIVVNTDCGAQKCTKVGPNTIGCR